MESINFEFLAAYDRRLVQLAGLAERYFTDDPATTLFKTRQFAEVLCGLIAAQAGLLEQGETFADRLRRLQFERVMPREAGELFHQLRVMGNRAAHEDKGTHAEALTALKVARQLGAWFHVSRSGDRKFNPGPFTPPRPPSDPAGPLKEELERLREELAASQTQAERHRAEAEQASEAHLGAEERARKEAEEKAEWARLAEETDAQLKELAGQLATVQAAAEAHPSEAEAFIEMGQAAAKDIKLDEAATRTIIDQQLRDAGWEADTQALRYAAGARPTKGRNLAIAEWPTATGPADFALFAGTALVGVIEAKRKNKNVMASLDQAERYAEGPKAVEAHLVDGAPWGAFAAPFAFSTNGRPYLRQLETASGIWRRDLRRKTNPAKALMAWPSPAGMLERLEVDREAAEAALEAQGFDFGFPLRPYQKAAVQAVEKGLAEDRTHMLVGMATGTGKTKLAIAMLYRLIAAKRFRRVCFVVDRSALGDQTEKEFTTTKVVSGKGFAETRAGDALFFEAFVTGLAKGVDHADDALIAAREMQRLLGGEAVYRSAIDEAEVFSLLGAALLRTGWSNDLGLLSSPCLVVRPGFDHFQI